MRNLLLVRDQGQRTCCRRVSSFSPCSCRSSAIKCGRAWRAKAAKRLPIEDLKKLSGGDLTGFVDNALGDFYEDRLRQALALEGVNVSEAALAPGSPTTHHRGRDARLSEQGQN